MKTEELVNKYNQLTSDDTKIKMIHGLAKTEYLPYLTKVTVCETVVRATSLERNDNGDPTGRLKVNNPIRYVLYTMRLIAEYMDIEIDMDSIIEEYDLLNQNHMIEEIISVIPKNEVDEMSTILSMVDNDTMTNYYEPHAYMQNLMDRIEVSIDKFITPVADSLTEGLKNVDTKTVLKVIQSMSNEKKVKK